jgi:hypothetical protein
LVCPSWNFDKSSETSAESTSVIVGGMVNERFAEPSCDIEPKDTYSGMAKCLGQDVDELQRHALLADRYVIRYSRT